ncbi:sensor histidine kinase [Thalassospira sp. MA62]|nr:sensor histidine kinase [Thalassospira sp. MA62]
MVMTVGLGAFAPATQAQVSPSPESDGAAAVPTPSEYSGQKTDIDPASEILVLPRHGIKGEINLIKFLQRLTNKTPPQSPEDVIALPESHFEPSYDTSGPGYTDRTVWYRMAFRITNDTDQANKTPGGENPRPQQLSFVELGFPYLNEIRLSILSQDTARVIWRDRVGDRVPDADGAATTLQHLAEWPRLGPGDYWLVLAVNTTSAHILTARLVSEETLIATMSSDTFWTSFLLGIVLVCGCVFLTFGLAARDKTVIWYAVYVFAVFLIGMAATGYAQYILGNRWSRASDLITGGGSAILNGAGLAMWVHIVALKRRHPIWHNVAITFCWVTMIVGCLLAPSDYYSYFTIAFFTPSAVLLVILLIYLIKVGRHDKRYFALVYFAFALGIPALVTILHLFMLFGFMPITALTLQAYPVGMSLHLILIGLALAYRMWRLSKQFVDATQRSQRAQRLAGEQRHFISMLSHEFRTPLAIIQRSAEILGLRLNAAPDAVHSRLTTIRRNASQLSQLVDAFLTKANLDNANFKTTLHATNLRTFLREMIVRRNRDVPEQQVILEIENLAVIDIDAVLFERAILNLIENARKYAPESPVRIAAERSATGYVLIRVIDRGPGISAEELGRVSDPFYRGRNTASTQGIGLGLHITQRIIEEHRGTMSIHVGEHGGTTVMIKLPYNHEATMALINPSNNLEMVDTRRSPPPFDQGALDESK